MTIRLDALVSPEPLGSLGGGCAVASEEGGADGIEIGIVNNMPDAALQSTERQFLGLLNSAAPGVPVRVRFFSLPGVSRSPLAQKHLEAGYESIEALERSPPDALIVTGTEPRAPALEDEPYWEGLARLVRWADDRSVATIWSCLAAHAAVRVLDGVERRRLEAKRVGVFPCATLDHPLLAGVGGPVLTPHSRYNDLRESDLTASGYQILTRSAEAGVDAFLRADRSVFLFFQGHPEYGRSSLWQEYRRDVWRYACGERDVYPDLPKNYLSPNIETQLAVFRERAESDRGPHIMREMPDPGDLRNKPKTWGGSATAIYRNWLAYVASQKQSAPGSAQ